MIPDRHPCPCCGYLTYQAPPGGTMQICPVCFWEDAPGQYWHNESNGMSLRKAQIAFGRIGAAGEAFLDAVRPPLAEEARAHGWRSMADEASILIHEIERVFANVRRDGGFSLHQMHILDYLDKPSEEDLIAAGKKDREKTWQELTPEKLDNFKSSLALLDAKGFRFYLPAYMHLFLSNWTDGGHHSCPGLVDSLKDGPDDDYGPSAGLLDTVQRTIIANFLCFVVRHGAEFFDEDDALLGLQNGWNKYATQPLTLPS